MAHDDSSDDKQQRAGKAHRVDSRSTRGRARAAEDAELRVLPPRVVALDAASRERAVGALARLLARSPTERNSDGTPDSHDAASHAISDVPDAGQCERDGRRSRLAARPDRPRAASRRRP